jgi:hypothetical protein
MNERMKKDQNQKNHTKKMQWLVNQELNFLNVRTGEYVFEMIEQLPTSENKINMEKKSCKMTQLFSELQAINVDKLPI